MTGSSKIPVSYPSFGSDTGNAGRLLFVVEARPEAADAPLGQLLDWITSNGTRREEQSHSAGMLRRMFSENVVGIVLVAAFLVWPTRVPAANLRKTAPNFTLNDSKGASVRLSDYKGRVVLLDFWATWCPWCEIEIPWYIEFQNKYKGKGLSVIGVSMDEDGWESVKPFREEKKMNYAVVVGNEDLAKLYAVDALPVTLLIDRDGKIADSHAGVVDKDAFENEIRVLLEDSVKNATK